MLSWLAKFATGKLISYLLYAGLGVFGVWIVNNYFYLRFQSKLDQETIQHLQNERRDNEIEMLEVEKRQYDNYKVQNKYLLQMDKNGYIKHGSDDNPQWLLYNTYKSSRS